MTFHPDGWAGGRGGPGDDGERGRPGGPGWPGGRGWAGTPSGPGDAGMRAALEKLPPGHPSSAWNADGTRRPPPPRLEDLELPLPGTWADTVDDDPTSGPAGPAGPEIGSPQNDPATREPPAL